MGRIVIVAYKPLANKESVLLTVLKKHLRILRKEGLATNRSPILMRSSNNTYLEVFEWLSSEAIEQAHQNSEVEQLWKKFSDCCTYETLSSLNESSDLFAEFEPIDL